jgi:hypothetical protein
LAGKIFINYRRGDDPGHTGRLFDRLQDVFPPEQLFLDVDNIAPGLDFVHVLNDRVAECDVLIAVIGRGWIDARDGAGKRRLEDPEDFVRIEIESALTQGKRVIPVLVGDAQMPRSEDLPQPLRPLSRRNAVRLTHERFRSDAQGLVKALQQALEDTAQRRQAELEAEQRAQKHRRLEDETAARAGENEQRSRREAEARQRTEEESAFAAANRANTVAALDAFLLAHGNGAFADEAQKARAALVAGEEARRRTEVQRALQAAKRANTVSAIEAFELTYPQTAFAEEAGQHKAALVAREEARQRADEDRRLQEASARERAEEDRAFAHVKRTSTVFAIDSFLAVYPATSHAEEAQRLKAALLARENAHRRAAESDDTAALRSFLTTYTRGADVDQIRARLRQLEPRQTWQLAKAAVIIPIALAVVVLGAATLWLDSRSGETPVPAAGTASNASVPPTNPSTQANVSNAPVPETGSSRQTKQPDTAPVPSPDEVAWALIKDSKSPDQLQRFVERFPASTHRPEAEERIASLPATAEKPPPAPGPDPHELARALQFELQRVGCFAGAVNGELDDTTKAAWQRFIKLTSINPPDTASPDAINAVRSIGKRVCPLVCPPGQHAQGEVCAVDAPPSPKRSEAHAAPAIAPPARMTPPPDTRPCRNPRWHRLPGGGCGY